MKLQMRMGFFFFSPFLCVLLWSKWEEKVNNHEDYIEEILLLTAETKGISYYKIRIWYTCLQKRFKGSVRWLVLQNIYSRIYFPFFF